MEAEQMLIIRKLAKDIKKTIRAVRLLCVTSIKSKLKLKFPLS